MMSEAQTALRELEARLADQATTPDDRARAERMRLVAAAEILAETSPEKAADNAELALGAWADAPADHEAVWALVHCAAVFHSAGRNERARETARRALELSSGTLDVYDPLVRRALETGGQALAALGRVEEAELMFEALRNISNFDSPAARATMAVRIARGLRASAPGTALEFASGAADILRQELGPTARAVVDAEVLAADCAAGAGDLQAAIDRLTRCADRARPSAIAAFPLEAMALLLSEAGRGEQAVAAIRDAVEVRALEETASLGGALTFHNAALIVSRHAVATGRGRESALAAYATALDAYALAGAPDAVVRRAGLEAAEVADGCAPRIAATIRSAVDRRAGAREIARAIRDAATV